MKWKGIALGFVIGMFAASIAFSSSAYGADWTFTKTVVIGGENPPIDFMIDRGENQYDYITFVPIPGMDLERKAGSLHVFRPIEMDGRRLLQQIHWQSGFGYIMEGGIAFIAGSFEQGEYHPVGPYTFIVNFFDAEKVANETDKTKAIAARASHANTTQQASLDELKAQGAAHSAKLLKQRKDLDAIKAKLGVKGQ